tara:strand:- start:37 stop:672 length:636 start_codon:yes stop_codon:yes gene_type:complete
VSTTRVQLIDKNTTVGTAAAEDTKIVFDGNAQDFHIGIDDSTDLLKIGGGTTLGDAMIAIDSAGAVTKPLQPAFLVQPTSVQSDFNQGQSVAVVFGTERFDLNADFASNTFTAPVTGKYRFDISIKVNGLSTQDSATYYYWTLVTSNRSYYHLSSVNELGSGNAGFTFSGSILADMDASDTASVTIIMGGTSGSGPSDISNDTYWSGNLVC